MPYVKKFRVEPYSNNIHIIFRLHHDLPRGLVVRIRRSHRRGPDSIPGVGIVSFLENLFLSVEGFDQSPRLCRDLDSLVSRKKRKSAFRFFSWIRYRFSYMTFNSWKSHNATRNQNKSFWPGITTKAVSRSEIFVDPLVMVIGLSGVQFGL